MNIITVCSTATYEKFATATQVKNMLGVTSTSDDDLFDELLERATEAIEAYVGYPLRRQTYLEKVPSFGTMYLQVSNTPIQQVVSIERDDQAVETTDYAVSDPYAGEIYRSAGWEWTAAMRLDLTEHVIPGSEENSWEVEYIGGFPEATSTTTELGLPKYLTQAAIETTKSWYLQRKQNSNLQSKKVGDLAVTFKGGNPGSAEDMLMLPDGAERLLRPLQRII